ncbi:MAG TPA: nucleotidyltransferase family protein [Candidatus Dormibacteraeota bacterium]|jgi:molybdenum cofactor cytidylyltransferase|nr:nucleotidyltransferase family protein [Candidatus Dormibacteraeota bacterium]
MLAAVILSGGASRRMGSPKALLPYQGRPFLEHLLDVAKHPSIGVLRVVLGPDADAISAQVALKPEEIVINQDWERGQLSSIQAAIRSFPPGTDGFLLCPVDHPLISESLVHELIDAFQKTHSAIVLPLYQGHRGHPVIFASRLYDELLNAPEEKGARAVVWAHPDEVSEIPTNEEGCILNLNDPEAFSKISSG